MDLILVASIKLFNDILLFNLHRQVDGVSEFVRSGFCLLLDLYQMDCEQFGDTKKTLYLHLLQRIIKLPWEAKAKYHRLCALLPYLGTDMVRINCYYSVNDAAVLLMMTSCMFLYSIRCWINMVKYPVIS